MNRLLLLVLPLLLLLLLPPGSFPTKMSHHPPKPHLRICEVLPAGSGVLPSDGQGEEQRLRNGGDLGSNRGLAIGLFAKNWEGLILAMRALLVGDARADRLVISARFQVFHGLSPSPLTRVISDEHTVTRASMPEP